MIFILKKYKHISIMGSFRGSCCCFCYYYYYYCKGSSRYFQSSLIVILNFLPAIAIFIFIFSLSFSDLNYINSTRRSCCCCCCCCCCHQGFFVHLLGLYTQFDSASLSLSLGEANENNTKPQSPISRLTFDF